MRRRLTPDLASELDGRSAEARLALRLARARDRAQLEPDWQGSAQSLDALLAEFDQEPLLWAGAGR
jgi:hypothetical protein